MISVNESVNDNADSSLTDGGTTLCEVDLGVVGDVAADDGGDVSHRPLLGGLAWIAGLVLPSWCCPALVVA